MIQIDPVIFNTATAIIGGLLLVLFTIIGFLSARYVRNNDDLHKEHSEMFNMMAETLSDMKVMLGIHSQQIKDHSEDIRNLQTVKYKKGG